MKNKLLVSQILAHKYYELALKNHNIDELISSLSIGIEDWLDWQEQDYRRLGYFKFSDKVFNDIKINICYRRKRLIKFNLRLTRLQKNTMFFNMHARSAKD